MEINDKTSFKEVCRNIFFWDRIFTLTILLAVILLSKMLWSLHWYFCRCQYVVTQMAYQFRSLAGSMGKKQYNSPRQFLTFLGKFPYKILYIASNDFNYLLYFNISGLVDFVSKRIDSKRRILQVFENLPEYLYLSWTENWRDKIPQPILFRIPVIISWNFWQWNLQIGIACIFWCEYESQ